jgi:hypothetical protein
LRFLDLTKEITPAKREKLSDSLLDLILDSGSADKLTAELARSLVDAARRDELASDRGLAILLEAGSLIEPEKAPASLEAQGFAELAGELKKATGK